ncbi:V-set domain containing T-cell activation inhibitor 1-like [Micropterus salmoides]|uniref:V-set domain containing T-cell activation inhibitor 1-like n=1 Tax=Micropterus salmoides TaxID=27706 RepID=UPI0018EC2F16|nr:V-set domain containing T-cell activation inhibitor 1-like [Micropterus salmoides]
MDKFVFLFILLSPAASDVVRVKPGDDVILPCQAGNVSIRGVEWTRTDLEPEYVLLYRDGRSDETLQHPSFKDQVQLLDRELKDGNVSLLLKNVSRNNAGTYECRVATEGSRRKRAIIKTKPIRIIQLEVSGSNSGDVEEGNYRHYYGSVAAFVLVCLAAVGLAVGWKYKRNADKKPEQSAAAEAVNDQLL